MVDKAEKKSHAHPLHIIPHPVAFYHKSTRFNQELMPFTLGCPVEKHTCFSAILHRVSVECSRMNGLHFNTGFHAKLVSGEIALFVFSRALPDSMKNGFAAAL